MFKRIPAFLFALSALLIIRCNSDSSEEKKESHKTYLNHHDSVRYVGMNTCRSCHQEIYDTYIQTGMGQSFNQASKEKSAGDYQQHQAVYDQQKDLYYYPYWAGETLMLKEFRLAGTDTVHQRTEKVEYIIGSGQHTNSHMMQVKGYVTQMPITFYTQDRKWDLPPGFENGDNSRFERKIGLECMSCHNAFPDFVFGSENKFHQVPGGIDCERCHGPGSAHVQLKSQGVLVDTSKYIDYSIVNPGKLPIDLQFDVCQRCHLQGNTVLKEGKSFYDFRPGKKLSDYMTVFLPKYEGDESHFIMASHADRLKMSACFVKSFQPAENASLRPYKESLTCVTCHDPHVSVKQTAAESFNQKCVACHLNEKNSCAASEKERKLKANNCVTCHMPKSSSIDIPHVRITDHYIRKRVSETELSKVKQFLGLFAINEEHPDRLTKAKAYINQYEKFTSNTAYLDSAEKLLHYTNRQELQQHFKALIQLYYLKNNYSQVLQLVNEFEQELLLNTILDKKDWDNNSAWTCYRIGEALYQFGKTEKALAFYSKADELASYYPDFKNKKGVALFTLNDMPSAEKLFQQAIAENPKFVPAINNLGYLYLLQGNTVKANDLFDRALSLDPDDEKTLMNKAQLYLLEDNRAGAKKILQRVIKLNPAQVQAKEALKQLSMSAS